MTTTKTLEETAAVFDELRALVDREPDLSGFVPVLIELQEQARLLTRGAKSVSPLKSVPPATMPTRELARKVTEIVSKLPPIEEDFDETMRAPLADLLVNLVDGVTGTIFAQFPEVIPHDAVE